MTDAYNHSIPEAALNTASAIVGRTGSGKTYTAKGAVEALLEAGRRVCVVDPTGAWWGLRRRADGSDGFPVVIFGGEHADVPITDASGARLGEIVASAEAPQCIVDVSEFSTGEIVRFLTAFFEALYTKNRAGIHLVLDEADIMAPQNPMPETRRLQGVVNKIVRRGRIKGFRPMMITQRPQVIDKSVLSQVDTLIAMRLTSPQDRKAILDWVKGHAGDAEAKEVIDALASLKTGEGFVWSPAQDILKRVQFPTICTFDSSRAPEETDEEIAPSPIDTHKISLLAKALAPKVDEPITKATKVVQPAPSAAEIEAAEQRGHKAGYVLGFHDGWNRCKASARIEFGDMPGDAAPPPAEYQPQPVPAPKQILKAEKKAAAPNDCGLTRGAAALLDVAVERWPARFSWTQLCTMNGTKARGGHFNTCRKMLVEGGHVSDDGGFVTPSASALKLAGVDPNRKVDAEELRETWQNVLPNPADKMLAYLIARTPNYPVTPDELGRALGMAPRGGHWNTGLRVLKDNDLIEVKDGKIRAAAHLWTNHGA